MFGFYYKLFTTLLLSKLKVKISVSDEFITRHHVPLVPYDHLITTNNSMYCGVSDTIRIELFVRSGIWDAARKRDLELHVTEESIRIFKPLKPFQNYQVKTKILGWDNTHFYIEHLFVSRKGFHAAVIVCICFKGLQERVLPPFLLITQASGYKNCPDQLDLFIENRDSFLKKYGKRFRRQTNSRNFRENGYIKQQRDT